MIHLEDILLEEDEIIEAIKGIFIPVHGDAEEVLEGYKKRQTAINKAQVKKLVDHLLAELQLDNLERLAVLQTEISSGG